MAQQQGIIEIDSDSEPDVKRSPTPKPRFQIAGKAPQRHKKFSDLPPRVQRELRVRCWDPAEFDELKPKMQNNLLELATLGMLVKDEENEKTLILNKPTAWDVISIDNENKESMLVQPPPLEQSWSFSATNTTPHDEEGETSIQGQPRESSSPPPNRGGRLGRSKRAATRIAASDDEEDEWPMQIPARESSPQSLSPSDAVQNKVVRRSKRVTAMARSKYNLEALSNGLERGEETRQKRRRISTVRASGTVRAVRSSGLSIGNHPKIDFQDPSLMTIFSGIPFSRGDGYIAYTRYQIWQSLGGDNVNTYQNTHESAARKGMTAYLCFNMLFNPTLPQYLTMDPKGYTQWEKLVATHGKLGRLIDVPDDCESAPMVQSIHIFVKAKMSDELPPGHHQHGLKHVKGMNWWVDLGWVTIGEPRAREWDSFSEETIRAWTLGGGGAVYIRPPTLLIDMPVLRVEILKDEEGNFVNCEDQTVKGKGYCPPGIVCRGECRKAKVEDNGEGEEVEGEAARMLKYFTFCTCLKHTAKKWKECCCPEGACVCIWKRREAKEKEYEASLRRRETGNDVKEEENGDREEEVGEANQEEDQAVKLEPMEEQNLLTDGVGTQNVGEFMEVKMEKE